MNLTNYDYLASESSLDYIFESVGPKGSIKKAVRFDKIEEGSYNLGFGDLNEKTGVVSDMTISNNEDTEKILATIAAITSDFTTIYPDSLIALKGTTAARTRLYQMKIAKYFDEINLDLEIRGLYNDTWEHFRKNRNYDAFAVWRK
jgi:hypothetical protein